METDRASQIEALLFGDAYAWAVNSGCIKSGEPLHVSHVFTVTRKDVVEYLRVRPVPGFDLRQEAYRGPTDGPKLHKAGNMYLIGWQERGIFNEEYATQKEAAAREYWINFLADSLGLDA